MYPGNVAEIEVTQSGSSVHLSVGDEIVVRVPEVPTTGYAWTVSTVDPALRLVESTFVPPVGNGSEPAPGAGGQRIIRLRAAAAGEAGAELALKRAWEAEAAPTETFTIHATVS
jgi:predicted secreted protein